MEFTAGYLVAMLVSSSVGMGLFVYGKKQARAPQLVAGIVLMLSSYVVTSAVALLAITAALIGAMWASIRAGM